MSQLTNRPPQPLLRQGLLVLAAGVFLAACPGDASVQRPKDDGSTPPPDRGQPVADQATIQYDGPHQWDQGVPVDAAVADLKLPPKPDMNPTPDIRPTPDLVPKPDTTPVFNDVPKTHEAYTAITWVSSQGYMRPCAPGQFCPDNNVLRSAAADNVVKMKYGSATGYPSTPCFNDVNASHPSFPAIQKLCAASIVSGTGNSQYRPNDDIKRSSAATLICKAKYGSNFSYPQTPYFTDVPATHWAFPYVQKLASVGVIVGGGGGLYSPDDPMQRKWWATMLHRAQSL